MAEISILGLVALVASSSVVAAGLTGLIQFRLEKSRRDADRHDRLRDERKELYVRYRAALDEYGSLSGAFEVSGEVLRILGGFVNTTIEMQMLASAEVSAAAMKAFDAFARWRNDAETAYKKAPSAEREQVLENERRQRVALQSMITDIQNLMRAELLGE